MEVTRRNFKDVLDQVSSAVTDAAFLAIDAEFSGLDTGRSIHAFDTPEQRYQKLMKAAKEFIIVQFGLSAFQYIEQTDRFEVRTFNFYICPRQYGRFGPDVHFKCQSSSIDFLACEGLDFTKVFRDGISYMLPDEYKRLSQSLTNKHNHQATHSSASLTAAKNSSIPEDHQPIIDNVIQQIESFMTSSDEYLDLTPHFAQIRRSIWRSVQQKFGAQLYLETVTNERHQQLIRVSHGKNDDERKQMEKERHAAECQELADAFGFSEVIDLISKSKKLVVGHNMILDVLHVLEHFIYPLPENYEEFKELAQCSFTRILDTKHMASSEPFTELISTTTLNDMLKELQKSPFHKPKIEFASEFTRYNGSVEYLHEAGYDSYITGLCFITMSQYLASKVKTPVKHFNPESAFIQHYVNKLHLMRMTDVPFINLSGPDPPLSRDHVFHITFPSDWKADNITQLFSAFGNVLIVWLNSTSAFVGLHRRDQSVTVLSSLVDAPNRNYKLLTYKKFVDTKCLSPASTKFNNPLKPVQVYHKQPVTPSAKLPSTASTSYGVKRVSSDVEESVSAKRQCLSTLAPNSSCGSPPPTEDVYVDVAATDKPVETSNNSNTAPGSSKHGEKLFEESDEWT